MNSILILEDEPAQALVMEKILKKSKIQNPLFILSDGDEGLSFIFGRGKYSDRSKYPKPGLIILDIKMPRTDGFEVLAAMSINEEEKKTPIVVVTSSTSDEEKNRCFKMGARAYLLKPISIDELLELIGTLMPGCMFFDEECSR